MKAGKGLILLILFHFQAFFSQQWSLKLSSNIELRSWILTNKADKKEKPAEGAEIKLTRDGAEIARTMSDLNGDFVIDIPANGDFILVITYAGCNTKRFYVSTKGVPEDVGKDKYKPTIVIGGFVLSKPLSGVDYIGLNEPLVKVEYKAKGQNFDKDDQVTNNGLRIVSSIAQAENVVIDKFCTNNKLGDDALAKKKCELAKEYYTKAMKILPDEKYPQERIKLADNCIELLKARQEEEAVAKAEAEKLAAEKAAKAKADKENAAFKKQNAVRQNTVASVEKTTVAKKTTTPPATHTTAASDKGYKEKPVTQGNISTWGGKYRVPGVLGADKYKELIQKADGYFKTKRYSEAKDSYTEALKYKDKDPYAVKKIEECDKMIAAVPEKK